MIRHAYSPTGRRFTVRLIEAGEHYGPKGNVLNDGQRLVEFFDADDRCWEAHPEEDRPVTWPLGNFTGGRYFLADLLDREASHDLALQGGVPEWTVTADSLRTALTALTSKES